RSYEIARLHLGTIVVFVGPVPIVFLLEMPVYLRADGDLSIGITTSVGQTANVVAGLQYTDGNWNPVTDLTNDFSFEPPTPTVGINLKGYIDPPLTLLLYGVAGPFASVKPYLELKTDAVAVPWWELHAGLEATVGVEVEVLGHSLGEHTEAVIGYDVLLAQAETDNITLTLEPPQVNGLTAMVSGTVTTTSGTITQLNWQWGDGNSDDQWFPASHAYAISGTYVITATAFDDLGGSAVQTTTVTIVPTNTISLILHAPEVVSQTVVVSGSVTATNSTITQLNWQWGDGSSGDQWFPASHTYAISGTYVITATAFDNLGNSVIQTTTVDVGLSLIGDGIMRVSVASNGTEANDDSKIVSISGNGRYVAFYSRANNLTPDDSDSYIDLFIQDQQTGIIEHVPESKLYSWGAVPDFSFDGRYIVFIGNDTIGGSDWKVCIYDQQISGLECIYLGDYSYSPKISSDGRFITFDTGADNLVPNDNNNHDDVFVYDRETGEISRVSVTSNGDEGNGYSRFPDISYDGRYIAFTSSAENFSEEDIDGEADVFLHDQQTGQTILIPFLSPVSGLLKIFQGSVSISEDARFIVVSVENSRPVPNDPNIPTIRELYIHDTQTNVTSSLLSSSSHDEPFGSFYTPIISGDGNYISYVRYRDPIVHGTLDVFVLNRVTGVIQRASASSDGILGNQDSGYNGLGISYNGQSVVFESLADNLVSNDSNGKGDIFINQFSTENTMEIGSNNISVSSP
ncbi:MAG: hypothetical protein KC415_12580, partial [Anaerolineales bacterium]|nr:hypothetical protein [Anaerolineales bacterium]